MDSERPRAHNKFLPFPPRFSLPSLLLSDKHEETLEYSRLLLQALGHLHRHEEELTCLRAFCTYVRRCRIPNPAKELYRTFAGSDLGCTGAQRQSFHISAFVLIFFFFWLSIRIAICTRVRGAAEPAR